MDADDISHPERFAQQVAYLDTHPRIDLLATRCVIIGKKGQIRGTLPFAQTHEEICARPWCGFYLPHPSWMGRLAWFQQNRYGDPAPYYCEDQELLLHSYRNSQFAALHDVLLGYRVSGPPTVRKFVRARSSLYWIQLRAFAKRREWLLVLLASTAFVLRMMRGILGGMLGIGELATLRQDIGNLSRDEIREWSALIASQNNDTLSIFNNHQNE